MVTFNNDWDEIFKGEFEKDYYIKLRKFLIEEYNTKVIYPDKDNLFQALKLTSFNNTKVVVIGQDPYHGPNQAHGLAFSVQPGVKIPPSLLNMYKELKEDLGCYIPNNGYLKKWATQGVLLLNAIFTVQEGKPNSHKGKGWEKFTDRIIEVLNEREKPVIFLLWGNNAKEKAKFITNKNHIILTALHPSPLSAHRGFFGCKHFSKCNEILKNNNEAEIDWQIENL
ncbi:MAG: uracil-DNA glycosylase [Clostridiaceae bacterium]